MSSSHYAAAAARLIRRAPAAAPAGHGARERSLDTIQRALAARRRKQIAWRAGVAVALSAAAAVVAVVGLRGDGQPALPPVAPALVSVRALGGAGASVVDAAQHRAVLRAGVELSSGSRVETNEGGRAVLRLSTGTELDVERESQLGLAINGKVQRFSLSAGSLEAKVAKLAAGERFLVTTPDAEVEVRGTRFELRVLGKPAACGADTAGSQTRLAVQEGVVEVRWSGQVAQIRAGQTWPEACSVRDEAEPKQAAVASTQKREPRESQTARVTPTAGGTTAGPVESPSDVAEPGPSALAAQTELFAKASRMARSGDVTSALNLYQQLVVTYPPSALAENSLVERMRLLRGSSPTAAKREAERYLARYPGGFGKTEAERILASP